MARITVEDCLTKLNNRFALIHLTAKRVRQLRRGAEPLVVCKNKDIVVALREIAAGKVFATHEEPLEGLPESGLDENPPQEISETESGAAAEEPVQELPAEEN